MSATGLVVPGRYCGPPASGNGGWVSGALAAHVPDPGRERGTGVEVTLRRPPPLDRPLAVAPREGGGVTLTDATGPEPVLVAEAAPTSLQPDELDVPPTVGLGEARAAEAAYPGVSAHPFPTCFVCGTQRAPGEALRLAPGPVGPGRMACSWDPAPWAAADGTVPDVLVWAALDCPGGWSAMTSAGRHAVLGRYAVRLLAPVPATAPLVVSGWLREWQGRKAHVGSALHDGSGRLLAVARATWVAVDLPTPG